MKKQFSQLFLWIAVIICGIIIFNPMFVYSADITGIWKAEFETQIGLQKYTFEFKQNGTEITATAISDIGGAIQEVILIEVKLDSNSISFVEMLPFQGMELRISYEGKISENEMKLNRNVGDFVTEEIIARREEIKK